MATPNMPSFDPGQVLMGGGGPKPYLPTNQAPRTDGGNPQPLGDPNPFPGGIKLSSPVLGSESVRASGKGPFDSAYRQNLATYSGGQFMRPGGSMSFNPTDASTFPGNPTGGGNAPLPGLPDSLISTAIGGNPFSFMPPTPAAAQPQNNGQPDLLSWQDWLQQFRQQGGGFKGNVQ